MSIIGTIHEDVTTDVLGTIGGWQRLITLVLTTLTLSAMFNQYEDMFLLQPSEVTCIPPENIQIVNTSICFITFKNMSTTEVVKCSKWHIKLMWIIWFRKTWLIFCDHKLKLISTAIISRLGLVFGCIIFGFISDSFGRKVAITINVFAELVLGLLITFCDSEGWFRLLVFLKSLFGSANFYMGLLIICEISSNGWRSWLNVIAMSPRLFATVCMVPFVNSAPNSETYSLIACLFCILDILLLRLIPESPQWLLFNRKIAVAEKLLLKAAKANGIQLCSDFKIRPVNQRAYNSIDDTMSCARVLRTYNVRVTFLVMFLYWMLYNFLWSSLYVKVYSEENIKQLLLKVFCFVGILGSLCTVLSAKLTLRHLLLIHTLITGAVIASTILFHKESIRSILSSIAISSGVVVHALILNMTPRLFAINIRATVFGCCHAAGQLGSIISYLLFLFHPMNDVTFLIVNITVSLILVGLTFLIVDVDGRELPDVMEDMDYFSELSKPLRWTTQKTRSPSTEEVQIRIYSFSSAGHNTSTESHSEDRMPAHPIGFMSFKQLLSEIVVRYEVGIFDIQIDTVLLIPFSESVYNFLYIGLEQGKDVAKRTRNWFK